MNRSAKSRAGSRRTSKAFWVLFVQVAGSAWISRNRHDGRDWLSSRSQPKSLNISLVIQIKTPQKARSALEITQGYLQYLAICGVWLDLPAVAQIRIVAAAGRSQLQAAVVVTLIGW